MRFDYAEGATPLNADEVNNLIPRHLTTQHELNEWEQFNIVQAEQWLFRRKQQDIYSLEFAQKLHHKMFDQTWKWAGEFRKTQTNIGVHSVYIGQELKKLFGDVCYWNNHNVYSIREISVILHHRLVFIHPFPNGNGRFSRLFADFVAISNNQPRFSWGKGSLTQDGIVRKLYIEALKEADNFNYQKLIEFADS